MKIKDTLWIASVIYDSIEGNFMTQRFNADTNALRERESVNAAAAVHNLEDWIIAQVHPRAGMQILDLGCGTGKQVFAFASRIVPEGRVLAVDISKQAVDVVNERARSSNLPQVSAVQCSFDNVLDLLQADRFDLIISSYAFYYATDMRRLLIGLRSVLKQKGQIFVCGPGDGTNQEMIDLINFTSSGGSNKAIPIRDFIDSADIDSARQNFANVTTVRLQNHIRFLAPELVMQWWRNHNSYVPEIDEAVEQAIRAHFREEGEFRLSKNVLGLHAHV